MERLDMWVTDIGPKLVSDMTREELIEALRDLGRMYYELLARQEHERKLL